MFFLSSGVILYIEGNTVSPHYTLSWENTMSTLSTFDAASQRVAMVKRLQAIAPELLLTMSGREVASLPCPALPAITRRGNPAGMRTTRKAKPVQSVSGLVKQNSPGANYFVIRRI